MLISSKRVVNHKERSQAMSRSQKPGPGLVPSATHSAEARSLRFLKAAALLPSDTAAPRHASQEQPGGTISLCAPYTGHYVWGFKTFFPLTTVFNHIFLIHSLF